MEKNCSNLVYRSLYRSLLRQARQIDLNPALKFLVVAKPKTAFDYDSNSIINFNFDTHDLNNFVERFTGGGQFYRPESSITQLVQNAFRTEELSDEIELASTGFSALRFLADINDMNQYLIESSYPALSVAGEDRSGNLKQITDFASVESFTGRLLITHPVSCIDQAEVHRAVVILHESSSDPDILNGYVINKPNKGVKLSEIWTDHVAAQFQNLGDCEVWKGGVMQGYAFLHTCPEIEGSKELDKGLYIHPMTTVDDTLKQFAKFRAAIEEKKASVDNIKFLHGVCSWSKKELLSELERTVYFLIDPPEEGVRYHIEKTASEPKNLWQSLLARFGGEYEQIAATPDFPRKVLERLSQGQRDTMSQLMKEPLN